MIAHPLSWLAGTALAVGLTALGWSAIPEPPPPPAAAALPKAAVPDDPARAAPVVVTVEARDLGSNEPVVGLAIRGWFLGSGQDFPGLTTDASGRVRFAVEHPDQIGGIDLFTSNTTGLVPLHLRWNPPGFQPGAAPLPDHFTLRTERGVRLGGQVRDPAGVPVAGASVVVRVRKRYPELAQVVARGSEPILTDAEGRWTITDAPADPDTVEVAAWHPLHRTDVTSYDLTAVADVARLRDGSAVVTIPPPGTRVAGVVVDPAGQPVAGAAVNLGESGGFSNSIPPIETRPDGRFAFGIRPGTNIELTATKPGFGPVGVAVAVTTEPRELTVRLPAPATLAGRVVDRAGRPIAGVAVELMWKPSGLTYVSHWDKAAGVKLTTDGDGRFAWPEAPQGEVQAELTAAGFAAQKAKLTAGAANQLTLTATTKIRVRVLDAASGAPITDFNLLPGVVWNPREPLIWQAADHFTVNRSTPAEFDLTVVEAADQVAFRVGGPDAVAAATPLIPLDGTRHELTLRLNRGEPINGRVVNPDGSPATTATVYLDRPEDSHQLTDGTMDPHEASRMIHAATAADGSFRLPPQGEAVAVLAVSDRGIGRIATGAFRSGSSITLQPWGRVEGTCRVEGAPAEGFWLNNDLSAISATDRAALPTEERIGVWVDAAGAFTIPRLTPGRHSFGQWVANNKPGRLWFVRLATVDVAPGATARVAIGNSGRSLTGRLALPGAAGPEPMIRVAMIEARNPAEPARDRGVRLLDAGRRFSVVDVLPGDYHLEVALHEPSPGDECGWGRLVGAYRHDFTVTGGAGDGPIDLGTLEPAEVGPAPLTVGAIAPPFQAGTATGQRLDSADLRDRVVLIDCWASWCAPCLAELPTLRAIATEFAADARFRMVGLNTDDDPAAARRVIDAERLTWPQALIGPDSPTTLAFGATAIPANFLVGPDGRIIARDLKGDALRQAIRAALAGR